MSKPDVFKDFEHTYASAIDDVVAFSHQGHEFFTRAKVDHLLDLVGRLVGDPASQCLLDVGCGPGATDAMLVPHVGGLFGVDVSAAMVGQARSANPSANYQVYDGVSLPYDNDEFDVVFTICVLHHVEPPKWQSFVQEIGRVTRTGGLTVVFEHNPYNPLTRRAVNHCDFDEGVTLLPRRTTTSLCLQAGMEVVEKRYILFVPVNRAVSRTADRVFGWLPAGAQYYVAARRS